MMNFKIKSKSGVIRKFTPAPETAHSPPEVIFDSTTHLDDRRTHALLDAAISGNHEDEVVATPDDDEPIELDEATRAPTPQDKIRSSLEEWVHKNAAEFGPAELQDFLSRIHRPGSKPKTKRRAKSRGYGQFCRARKWNHADPTRCSAAACSGSDYCDLPNHRMGNVTDHAGVRVPAMECVGSMRGRFCKPKDSLGHFFGDFDEWQAGTDPADKILPFMDRAGYLIYWWEANAEEDLTGMAKSKWTRKVCHGDERDDNYKQCRFQADWINSGRCKIPLGYPKKKEMIRYGVEKSKWP